MSHFADFLFPLVIFGPALITSIVFVNSLQSGSYQKRTAGSNLLFQGPVAGVVFLVTLIFNLMVLCILINDKPLFDTLINIYLRRIPAQLDIVKPLLDFASLAAVLYWLIIYWYKKTCYLMLDKDKRTYRTIDMAGMKLKVRTGSWDELSGICVKRTSAKGTVIFYVRLSWNKPAGLASTLGGFSKQDKAEAFAAKMSKELGLPLVAASAPYSLPLIFLTVWAGRFRVT